MPKVAQLGNSGSPPHMVILGVNEARQAFRALTQGWNIASPLKVVTEVTITFEFKPPEMNTVVWR